MAIITSKLDEKDKQNLDQTLEELTNRLEKIKDEDIIIDDEHPEITKEMIDDAKSNGTYFSGKNAIFDLIEDKKKQGKKTKLNKSKPLTITLQFNPEVLSFIKQKQPKGYQTLINEVMTEWAKHHGMRV